MKERLLIVIPARSGSKRIPQKNIRLFAGKPLIAHTVRQARKVSFADRIIVDTDSEKVARVARKAGAEVPFLRPQRLARDSSNVVDSTLHLLSRLRKNEEYAPQYVMLLQTTSPLRELSDIEASWKLMQKGRATTVLTIAPTHPRLYHMDKRKFIKLVNAFERGSTNMQAWPPAYLLNGCFVYIVKTSALLSERRIITKKTQAIVCPKWRSIDLDTPEEWVLAEHVFKNKKKIERAIKKLEKGTQRLVL